MFSSKFFYFILFLIFIDANAQNNEQINSDRPDQSEGTYILTKNSFQIENGLLLQDKEMINNLMIRYGLTKKTEFRIVSDFGLKNFDDDLNTIGISFKHNLLEQNKAIPEITLVGYYRNKIKNKFEFQKNENYALIIAFQNILSEKLIVGYNLGTNSFGKSIITTFFTNYIFSKKITAYAECFSYFLKTEASNYNFDIGLFYSVNHSLQFDIAYGQTINKITNPYLTIGFSVKFDKK